MTRIGAIQGGGLAVRRAARGAGGFALTGRSEAAETAPAAAPVAPSALLALQETPMAEPAEERARRRGQAALDELRGLQLDLLRGQADPGRLERLAGLAGSAGEAADPALRAVLAEIALRARVELARLRVASASTA